jgi:hypothetical protein
MILRALVILLTSTIAPIPAEAQVRLLGGGV